MTAREGSEETKGVFFVLNVFNSCGSQLVSVRNCGGGLNGIYSKQSRTLLWSQGYY